MKELNDEGTIWWEINMTKGLHDEGTIWWKNHMIKGLYEEGTTCWEGYMMSRQNDEGIIWEKIMFQVDPSMVVRAYIRLPVFWRIRLPVFSLPCHVSDSLFRRNSCTALLFFLLIQYADSYLLHASHLHFIHSCVASCFSFHVSARLYSFIRFVLPLFSCISQSSFIHALHSASPCIYQPRSLEPPWLIILFDMYQDRHTALCSGDTSR